VAGFCPILDSFEKNYREADKPAPRLAGMMVMMKELFLPAQTRLA